MKIQELENKILKFWKENKIFEKSLKARKRGPRFVFYDGPPFANGLPHYGHILAMAIKDLVTRYKTMQGYYVPRRNGWDCHGLPVEYEAEKKLGISGRRKIEKYGIEKFNQCCRESVFRYTKEWEETMRRMARWIDFKNSYATLDNNYTESVWWVFKQLWDKGLVYRDFRSVSYCPRCSTPLSNFEVNLGYKDNVEDPSIFVKFLLLNSKDTYFLAWTTTPWTLSGNAALAIGEEIDYVKIALSNSESLILAEVNLSVITEEFKIIEKFKGKNLVGMKYQPLYHLDLEIQNSNLYKVVSADFVSLEEGTGIVHIAPAYGEEDFNLGKEKNIPPIVTINENGEFKQELKYNNSQLIIKGKFIKEADKDIIENLKERNLLYKAQTVKHTYPFCWRCEAPVYDFLWPSWFVKVTKIKDELIENNKKIYWMPHHLKEGRFGKWLEGVRDWNVSRNRFWGAPIPVWICRECEHTECIESIKEIIALKDYRKTKSGYKNNYLLLRHVEADNVERIVSSWPEIEIARLTKEGKKDLKKLVQKIKKEKIDLIFSSDIYRTKVTAEAIAKEYGLKVNYDSRLRETDYGIFNGKPVKEYQNFFENEMQKFEKAPKDGETLKEVKERTFNFAKELEKKYKNKNILIVTHADPLWVLEGAMKGMDEVEILKIPYPQPGECRKINQLLDLHCPYIDQVVLKCPKCKGKMKRTPEILDCWFESGAMPYAQYHYPFENKKEFKENFPADFIAEGLDQTRGWFYTLNVLSAALFNQPAFKNVVVNGIVLAEDGKKLSKRLKNYPEPKEIFDTLGVDALRYFLYSSAPMGEDYRFSEQRVREKLQNLILPFLNVYSFFELYRKKSNFREDLSFSNHLHILDQWILARLNQLIKEVTNYLDEYDLAKASRPFENFVKDLSTWYLRRSRERFKGMIAQDTEEANPQKVLYYILLTLSKLLAPFTPFVSEEIYQNLKLSKDPESVHLCSWPKVDKESIKEELLEEMEIVRDICELAHKARAEASIKVRQPLLLLQILPQDLSLQFLEKRIDLKNLIKKEINIKEIEIVKRLPKADEVSSQEWKIIESSKLKIALNLKIIPSLKREGLKREIVRQINTLRKKANLTIKDRIVLYWKTKSKEIEEAFKHFKKEIEKETISQVSNFKSLKLHPSEIFFEKELLVEGEKVWIGFSLVH